MGRFPMNTGGLEGCKPSLKGRILVKQGKKRKAAILHSSWISYPLRLDNDDSTHYHRSTCEVALGRRWHHAKL